MYVYTYIAGAFLYIMLQSVWIPRERPPMPTQGIPTTFWPVRILSWAFTVRILSHYEYLVSKFLVWLVGIPYITLYGIIWTLGEWHHILHGDTHQYPWGIISEPPGQSQKSWVNLGNHSDWLITDNKYNKQADNIYKKF